MLYKIDDKIYVKTSGYYIEVEVVYNNGEIGLKPTANKIECNPNIKFEYTNIQEVENSFKSKKNKYKQTEKSKSFTDKEFYR